jgi:putative acetyltransferase
MMTFVQAETEEHIRHAQELFTEYVEWLRTDVDTVLEDINDVPAMSGYKDEIAGLPGKYAPPDGRLLLAYDEGRIAGCGCFYKYDEGVCEMKRVWVRPEFRGQKVGRLLVEMLIADARKADYTTMLLSTADKLKAALALYASLGFVETEPYYESPPEVLDYEIFLKLDLSK